MDAKKSETPHWGLGLQGHELELIKDGVTEVHLTRDRMPLFEAGDTIKLVDWGTEQECSAEVLERIEMCSYRIKVASGFEPIVRNLAEQRSLDRKIA